jgi:DNA (cytosine-5)-methyltransferase 1
VSFVTLSIEGYGDTDCHSVSESIWIQTQLGETSKVLYRLTTPKTDYFKHHSTFPWIADLGKYFVDYLLERDSVALVDFQGKFHQWLVKLYGYSTGFQGWINQFGSSNFRSAVITYIEYLWKDAYDIIPNQDVVKHPLWSETRPAALATVPPQHSICAKNNLTIVTPFVHRCFRDMYFGDVPEVRRVKRAAILYAHLSRKEKLGFPDGSPSKSFVLPEMVYPRMIKIGDILGVMKDVDTKWKENSDTWYVT